MTDNNETTWIEDDWQYWECKKCNGSWVFNEYGPPAENDYHYCPKCGRKITEFVKFRHPWEDEE